LHHTAHPDILDQIYNSLGEKDWTTKLHIAQNPSTRPETLHKIIDTKHGRVTDDLHANVAFNPSATPDIFKKLAAHDSSSVREVVARSEYTPQSILHSLANDPNKLVQKNVLYNANTHPDVKHYMRTKLDI